MFYCCVCFQRAALFDMYMASVLLVLQHVIDLVHISGKSLALNSADLQLH